MFNLGNIFELVINGFNNTAFSQHNFVEQGDDLGFHIFLEFGDQLNIIQGQKFSEFFEM